MASRRRKGGGKPVRPGGPTPPNKPAQCGGGETTPIPARFDSLVRGLADSPLRIDLLVVEPAGYEKMCVVMEDFLEPWLHTAEGLEQRQELYYIGATAWNIALYPQHERQALIRHALAEYCESPDERAVLRRTLAALVARKDALFAANRRFIANVDVQPTPEGSFYISVAATLEGGPPVGAALRSGSGGAAPPLAPAHRRLLGSLAKAIQVGLSRLGRR